MTRTQRTAEREADEAATRYATAPRGRKMLRLTLAQIARLRALKAGIRAKRRAGA